MPQPNDESIDVPGKMTVLNKTSLTTMTTRHHRMDILGRTIIRYIIEICIITCYRCISVHANPSARILCTMADDKLPPKLLLLSLASVQVDYLAKLYSSEIGNSVSANKQCAAIIIIDIVMFIEVSLCKVVSHIYRLSCPCEFRMSE